MTDVSPSQFEIQGPHASGWGVRLTLVREGNIMKKPFTTVTVVVLAVGGHRARTAIDFRPLSLSPLVVLRFPCGKRGRLGGGGRAGDWDLTRKSLSAVDVQAKISDDSYH